MQSTTAISLSKRNTNEVKDRDYLFFTLVLLALAIDLFTPYLIWKEIIPAEVRWLSHAAILGMMLVALMRMLVFDHVPSILWLIVGISLIGGTVAFANGQDPVATLWGWWTMFQYPFVGLFAYLQPNWLDNFPRKLMVLIMSILALNVVLQIVQYVQGESLGDNLTGFFGDHGTTNLGVFIILLLCLALGYWLAKGEWRLMLLVLGLGSVSSLLAEIKLFPFAAIGLGFLSVFLIVLRGKGVARVVPYSLLFMGIVAIFALSYNALIPAAERRPLESFLQQETLDQYFGFVNREFIGGQYQYTNVGRSFALNYAWEKVTQDMKTFVLGKGLGAGSESQTLGVSGIGFANNELSLISGSSLLVIMQELALLGVLALAGFFIWLFSYLYKDFRAEPYSELSAVRYGLLLFSFLWPIWLWYSSVWVFRVPMLIYWVLMGYVLSHTNGKGRPITASALEKGKGNIRKMNVSRVGIQGP